MRARDVFLMQILSPRRRKAGWRMTCWMASRKPWPRRDTTTRTASRNMLPRSVTRATFVESQGSFEHIEKCIQIFSRLYTNNLQELVRLECTEIPTLIFRPAIIAGIWKDGIPGWADSLQGMTAGAMGVSCWCLMWLTLLWIVMRFSCTLALWTRIYWFMMIQHPLFSTAPAHFLVCRATWRIRPTSCPSMSCPTCSSAVPPIDCIWPRKSESSLH